MALAEVKREIQQNGRKIGNIAVVSMVFIYSVFPASQTKQELEILVSLGRCLKNCTVQKVFSIHSISQRGNCKPY